MNNFLILHSTGLVYNILHNIPIFESNSIFGMLVVSSHLLVFVNGNKDIFLSDYHIWKCLNLNSHIS